MHNKHNQATALSLLALILIIFAPQSYAAPSDPNAVLEASGNGLAYLEVELRPKSGKDPVRLQIKGSEGRIVSSVTLPAESSDYEITAFNTDGKVTFFGKGSIRSLLEGDAPIQISLPPANPEEGKNDGLIVSLARERVTFDVKALDKPDNFTIEAHVTDPRGNPVKLDPNSVKWGITDPTHFELIPLKDRFVAELRPIDGSTIVTPPIQAGVLCITPPQVVLCVANRVCKSVPVCTDPWFQISAGSSHTCALKQSGVAFCWGTNNLDELGAVSNETCIAFNDKCATRPLRVACPTGAPCRFTQIAAGQAFTVATDFNGDTWSWGISAANHTKVSASNGTKALVFEQVTAGLGHGCGIVKGGELWCWGDNTFGQAGAALPMRRVPFDSAVRVLSPLKFAKVAAGGEHTCAMTIGGNEVACWGRDDQQQVTGRNPTAFPPGGTQFFFQRFGGIASILDVAVSGTSSCVKRGNGNSPNCWGQISPLNLTQFGTPDQVAAGGDHFCAITGQQASCLGANFSGQLGIGSMMDQPSPVTPNPSSLQFASLSTGTAHTCGISLDGDAFCWGRALEGQIGNGASNWGVLEPAQIIAP